MSHPSFGKIPPDVFKKAMEAPALVCHSILRKYEPSFGKYGYVGDEEKEYIVNITKTSEKTVTTTYKATTTVKAATEVVAMEIAEEMARNDKLNWREIDGDETEDFTSYKGTAEEVFYK